MTAHDDASSSSSSSSHNVLLAGLHCRGNIHLVVGSASPLAASRCAQSLGAGAVPVLVAPAAAELHCGLRTKIEDGSVRWERKAFEDGDLFRLGREEVGGVVDAVFVTTGSRTQQTAHIVALCRRNRIPVNVVDSPDLCSLTLLSTYADGPLQIGVTTNGRGCKLASRIRREIAAVLPPRLGAATARLGSARRRIIQQDLTATSTTTTATRQHDLEDSVGQDASFNRLVTEDDDDDVKTRRMRWLGQICEYWPLSRLAAVTDDDVERLLASYAAAAAAAASSSSGTELKSRPSLSSHPPEEQATTANREEKTKRPLGRLILAGSGPGHPDLVTRATHRAIMAADLVLADKLVPSGVLALIPRRTPVQIARKFPGNAELAQRELLDAALAGVEAGRTVVRLKQGDPFLYGRGGEEVAFFRARGLGARVDVLPGLSSALAAPLFAGIPPTQRGVADQVLVCTGTGRRGAAPDPPEYVASRTVVFLMALHRIADLVRQLTTTTTATPSALPVPAAAATAEDAEEEADKNRSSPPRPPWPLTTPCAVIERASCPDQRVIRTTLAHVVDAIHAEGSRPPGLLVVGAACTALDDDADVSPSPSSSSSPPAADWVVEDGFHGLDGLGELSASELVDEYLGGADAGAGDGVAAAAVAV